MASNRMIIKHMVWVACPHCGNWDEQSGQRKHHIKQMKQEMRKHIKSCPEKNRVLKEQENQ